MVENLSFFSDQLFVSKGGKHCFAEVRIPTRNIATSAAEAERIQELVTIALILSALSSNDN